MFQQTRRIVNRIILPNNHSISRKFYTYNIHPKESIKNEIFLPGKRMLCKRYRRNAFLHKQISTAAITSDGGKSQDNGVDNVDITNQTYQADTNLDDGISMLNNLHTHEKIFGVNTAINAAPANKQCKYSHVQAMSQSSYNFHYREYMESVLGMEDDFFGMTLNDTEILNIGKEQQDIEKLDVYYKKMKDVGAPVSVNTFNVLLYGYRLSIGSLSQWERNDATERAYSYLKEM